MTSFLNFHYMRLKYIRLKQMMWCVSYRTWPFRPIVLFTAPHFHLSNFSRLCVISSKTKHKKSRAHSNGCMFLFVQEALARSRQLTPSHSAGVWARAETMLWLWFNMVPSPIFPTHNHSHHFHLFTPPPPCFLTMLVCSLFLDRWFSL